MREKAKSKGCKITTEDTEKKIEGTESAWWGAGKGMQGSDDLNVVVINRILGESPKISKFLFRE